MTLLAGIVKIGPNRYRIRAQARDPRTGGKISRMETLEGTQRQAVVRLAALRAELRKSGKRAVRRRLGDYATSWLISRAERLKPGTRHKYANNIELHIVPAMGSLYLDSVVPDDVRRFLSRKTKEGLSAYTIRNMLVLLRKIAKDAQADGETSRYFCERVEAPTPEGYTDEKPNLLDAEQLQRLLVAIPARWLATTLMLAYTGMRWGEMTALRWGDVAGGAIKIRRGNWRGFESTPKTPKSKRNVPLPRQVVDLLGGEGHPKALLFPVTKGKRRGLVQKAVPLTKVLNKACVVAGVPRITPHGLRRTFNDLSRQVTDRIVTMSIMGHSTETMHAHYSRVGIGEKAAAQELVRALVEGPVEPPPVCPACRFEVADAWKFCPACGANLVAPVLNGEQ